MYYLCRKHFQSKEHKHYFVIKVYNDLTDDVATFYVEENVYNNYDKIEPFTRIDDNKFEKTSYQNKYGSIVSSYKLIK